jgi:predicted transcriptional regulator
MKTIKNIADELGIPKHKVRYQVEKLPQNCVQKIEEILHVNDEGMAILRGLEVGKKNPEPQNKTAELYSDVIEVLKGELEAKNKQIEAQSRQITELTNALTAAQQTAAAAQALHAGTIKNISTGEKTSFFGRLFNRK